MHDTEDFTVTSYGNGLGYELRNKTQRHYVFFQGDDATAFREELRAMEEKEPETLTNTLLARLWSEYGEITKPDLPF